MSADDENDMNFEEMLRSMASEVSRSLDDQLAQADIEGAAEAFGLDPDAARGWVDTAGEWLRAQVEHMGEGMSTPQPAGAEDRSRGRPARRSRPASARYPDRRPGSGAGRARFGTLDG